MENIKKAVYYICDDHDWGYVSYLIRTILKLGDGPYHFLYFILRGYLKYPLVLFSLSISTSLSANHWG